MRVVRPRRHGRAGTCCQPESSQDGRIAKVSRSSYREMAAAPEFREADIRYANRAGMLFLALIFSVGTAAAQEPAAKEDAEKRQGVTLTIYNGDTEIGRASCRERVCQYG